MTFKEFLNKKGHSTDAFVSLEMSEQAKIHTEFLDEIGKGLDSKATKEDITSALTKAVEEINKTTGEEIRNQIAEMTKNAPEFKHLKQLVKDNFETIKENIKKGNTQDLFVVKAPEIHRTDNDVVTFDTTVNFEVGDNVINDSSIVKIRYPENFILNYISNRLVAKVPTQYRRIEQVDKEGALAITPEGEIKPLVDYSFIMTATDREKAACSIEWSEEFEYDWEALFNEIVRMLETDCIREWQQFILQAIFAEATPYVASALDLTLSNPDNGHVAMAAQAQLEALNYQANLVLMNPGDWTVLKTQQDNEGRPVILPYVGANDINGMTVVRNNYIPQGTMYVMDRSIFTEIHGGFMFRTGQYNDQLIRNLYTLIAEVFFILNIAQRDKVGIVEVDIDVVKTLLLKP